MNFHVLRKCFSSANFLFRFFPDHTFCRECIHKALSDSETCPNDRSDLTTADLMKSPKIICNQLDNLKVNCPCCESILPRSLLSNHLEKYCLEALIQCAATNDPEQACNKMVKRKLKEKGCLHYLTTCEECNSIIMQIEVEDHKEKICKERNVSCELCSEEILRCQQSQHDEICPDKIIPCKYEGYGCKFIAKRISQQDHLNDDCAYRIIGPVADTLLEQHEAHHIQIRTLLEKNDFLERRIKFLERSTSAVDRLMDSADDLPNHFPSNFPLGPTYEHTAPDPGSSEEYMLALIEAQGHRADRLATAVSELDSRQTQMLFNETMPIKNELNDIRSNLQVNSMHIRWLMRFRIQENQRRFGSGAGGGGGGPGGGGGGSDGSGESPLPRRLSDSRTML